MQNYKMTVSYDGSRFNGWQRQKNSKDTIQELFEKTLSKVLRRETEIIASGRTDAGVHAYGQVVNFKTSSKLSKEEIMDAINEELPGDIAVRSIEEVDERFHARYNAKMKIYEYRILNHKCHDPFERKYTYHYPEALDINLMKEGAKLLVGQHDFKGFSTGKTGSKTTVRAIGSIDIKKSGREVVISYVGDGFLYNMARILTGTLIEIGTGKREISSITKVFETNDRQLAGFTAPPEGLFLKEVIY